MAPKISVVQLAKEKWTASGLTDAHARKLKLQALTKEQTGALAGNFLPVAALKIPYFTIDGKVTQFYRVRYLEQLPGFAGALKKPQRYAQPSGTMNEAYFPPLLNGKTWKEVLEDPEVPLYFTEGELKAAAACSAGLCCIGLGGVDVWRSAKRGMVILPSLAKIKWEGRPVCIVYDSDAATNVNVVRAQRQLALEFLARGAEPAIASLPHGAGGKKQGLDDFLVASGADNLVKLVNEAPGFPESEALWAMNEEVVYVKDPGLVIVRDSGQRLNPQAFVQHQYSNRHYLEQKIVKDAVKLEKKQLAPRWMEWEQRFEVKSITFAPGQPQLYNGKWNTWKGWGCEPKKGDIGPWKWLLDFIFKNEDPMARQWFERWCAYPFQDPGVKMFSSALIWGVFQGTGKTLTGHTLMRIYGKDNAREIKDDDLNGNFNGWAENKQFIYADEVTGKDGEKRQLNDKLKGMITQEDLTIKVKYIPDYVVPDKVNYLFSSQHPDAFFVEDTDRRFFIHELVGPPADIALYKKYDAWLKGEGPSALFYHFLKMNIGDFDPKAHAPMTTSKRAMIVDNKSDMGLWVASLREDPLTALRSLGEHIAHKAELVTPTQLLRAYDPLNEKKVTVNGLSRELKRSGFRQVNHGTPIKTQVAGLQRLYIVRNHHKWPSATPIECARHYDEVFGGKKF